MKIKFFFLYTIFVVLPAIVSKPLSAEGLQLTDPCINHNHFFYVGIEVGDKSFSGIPQFGYAFTALGANQPTSPFEPFSIDQDPHGDYFAPIAKVRIPIASFFNTACKWLPHEIFIQTSGDFFRAFFKQNIDAANAGILLVLPINGVTMSNPLFAVGEVRRTFDYKTYNVELSTSYSTSIFSQRLILEPILAFSLGHLNQNYTIQAKVFPGLLNNLRLVEELKTSYYDFGIGINSSFPLIYHFSLFAKGLIYLTSMYAHLDSSIGFNAPVNFNIIKTGTTDLAPTGVCQLGLLCQLWCGELALVGGYEYRNTVAAILNPEILTAGGQPLERFPLLQKESFSNYSIGLRLGITL